MKLIEAQELVRGYDGLVVRTAKGNEYHVAWDTLIECENGYVYGARVNAPAKRGPFRNRAVAGDIKWFDLKNVELVKVGDPATSDFYWKCFNDFDNRKKNTCP